MSERDKRFLSDADRERYSASHNLPWMYEAAVNAHQAYLTKLGVHACDARRFPEQNGCNGKSRGYMYKFILQVMGEDEYFAELMEPHVHAVALLFEEKS